VDLLTIVTAYLFVFYGPAAGGAFAFGLGLLLDLFSGGLFGLFAALHLAVFGSIYFGSMFFNLLEPRGQAFLIALAVLLKKLLFVLLIAVFSGEIAFSQSFFWVCGISVIVTGAIAPILFAFLGLVQPVSLENFVRTSKEEF